MLKLFFILNVFGENLLQRYDGEDATFEILLMLLIAALFGFLLRHFIGFRKKEFIIEQDKNETIVDNQDLSSLIFRLSAEVDRLSALSTNGVLEDGTEKLSLKSKNLSGRSKVTEKAQTIIEPMSQKGNVSNPVGEIKKDDLKVIEGIGPALERMLNENNIFSYNQLADHTVEQLDNLLDKAGPRFRVHVPETWPEQAALLRDGKLNEFKILTEKLKGGRRV